MKDSKTNPDEVTVVLFTGMDNVDYELELESEAQAQHEAAKLSELGCQCVAVVPIDKKTGIGREPYSCE